MYFVLLLSFLTQLLAISEQEKQWLIWKDETYKEFLSSPTSFLNAYSLSQAPAGESLYLVLGTTLSENQWVAQKPKVFEIQAEHLGDKVKVTEKGKILTYLDIKPENNRKKIPLSNGAIAEVVFGKRNKKLWAYLYDPQQIKKFTGFRFYPFNSKAIVEGVFKSSPKKSVKYKTVQGDLTEVTMIGGINFQLMGQSFSLPAYMWTSPGESHKNLSFIFTDATAGTETYGGGRELSVPLAKDPKDGDQIKLDFNRTTNFYCAHSPFWHCPMGLQTKLSIALKAGEMVPVKKIVE